MAHGDAGSAAELDSMLETSAAEGAWSTELASEWWELHMPDVDVRADMERIRELSPEEIIRIGE